MIAMLLGAFLTGGIMEIFLGSRQTYRMQENLSRLQENGRFAMGFITRDNRTIGFQGCASRSIASGAIIPVNITDPKNPNPNPAFVLLPGGVTGSNNATNNWSASACGAANACVAGTDAITYQFNRSCGGYLTGNLAPANANIQITAPNTCDVNQYDTLMISDCRAADIFIATSAPPGGGTQTIAHANNQNTGNRTGTYGPDAEVLVFRSYSFFIRNNASGEPALWRLDNAKPLNATNPAELVEGVENMQIVYGEDTNTPADNIANYYVPANAVVNWANVVSVRISLVIRSMTDNLAAQPLAYAYNGATITPTDRRLRQVFTSTIALRNRLP